MKPKYAYIDIEANGLEIDEVTEIFCVAVSDDLSPEPSLFVLPKNKDILLEYLDTLNENGYTFVAHNGIDYDFPVMEKLLDWPRPYRYLDTLVMSRICHTEFTGRRPHALASWGERLGMPKDDYQGGFDEYNEEMGRYCQQDVRILPGIVKALEATPNFKPEVIDLEQKVQTIITMQRHNGFWFDIDEARVLVEDLQKESVSLQEKVNEIIPPTVTELGNPEYWEAGGERYSTKKQAKAAGWRNSEILRGPNRVKREDFNPNSDLQVGTALMERCGWKPTEFTPTGQPQISLELLEGMDGVLPSLFYQYKTVEKRLSQIISGSGSWFHYFNERTHRIHGTVNAQGTRTYRMSHNSPNMSAVPANDKPFGVRCRSLFRARPGWYLVGADASGLEARVLSHFLHYYDGGEFARIFLDPDEDFHSANAQALGIGRSTAKTWFYAYIYGAGDLKLGAILGGTAKDGKISREKFRSRFKGFGGIAKDLSRMHKKGYIIGLDGRRVQSVSEHSALNTLCQSAGAIVMKWALVDLKLTIDDALVWEHGSEYGFCANSHDEWQIEVPDEEAAHMLGKQAVASIQAAGRKYNFNCPLDGEYKIGKSWAETH